MTIGVTGGHGFIGSYVVKRLKDQGRAAIPLDLTHGFDVVEDPIPDTVTHGLVHLAGVLGTEELFADPHKAVDVNVHGSLNMIQECERKGMPYVGITMPDVWANVYQATKHCTKRLATAWHRTFGLPVSHVRAYNAYGPGQKVHGVQKIVPTFASRAWRNEPIPIWGDGSQVVDLVWVGDIARMLVDALDHGGDVTFDAGTGHAWTVHEVAQMVLDLTGSEAGIQWLPMRQGEDAALAVADGEGWNLLDWKPEWEYERFEETVNWYREDRK